MACRECRSENLQKFSAELTASLPNVKDIKVPPVYLCQELVVCLACGFAELHVPSAELQVLNKNKEALSSKEPPAQSKSA
jgi:predicted nucleic-acid-binding Zn-ribbon protein